MTAFHRSLWAFCFVTGLLLVSGCGKFKYNTTVSALVAPGGELKRSYFLFPGNAGTTADDLQFREFAAYLDRAMTLQGFKRAANAESAELLVVTTYAISDPQSRVETYSVRHWGQTGVASATTVGTASSFGTLATHGNTGTYSGTTSYSGTTTYQPTYGVTGYSTEVRQYTTYTRVLELVAFDTASIRAGASPKEMWRVSAVSTGIGSDLREFIPYMVAAARPYIGGRTDQAILISIPFGDERVAEILPPSPSIDAVAN